MIEKRCCALLQLRILEYSTTCWHAVRQQKHTKPGHSWDCACLVLWQCHFGKSEGKSDLEKLMGYRHSSIPWRSKRDFQLESSSSANPLHHPPLTTEAVCGCTWKASKSIALEDTRTMHCHPAGCSSCLTFDNATHTLRLHSAWRAQHGTSFSGEKQFT